MAEIAEKMPFTTVYEWLGSESGVKALADKFYDLMDLEPAYSHLRSLHQADLQHSRDTLFWFLCGWTGGPPHYEQRFGPSQFFRQLRLLKAVDDYVRTGQG